jgi:predicted transcriptional regulator
MKVLLAIKEEFATKIFDGSKRYEFRKSIFKRSGITSVVVYVTAPTAKVVGEFEIGEVLIGEPEKLWEQTKQASGITKKFYDQYFDDRNTAYAIEVKSVNRYRTPKDLRNDFNIGFAPQSWVYLNAQL